MHMLCLHPVTTITFIRIFRARYSHSWPVKNACHAYATFGAFCMCMILSSSQQARMTKRARVSNNSKVEGIHWWKKTDTHKLLLEYGRLRNKSLDRVSSYQFDTMQSKNRAGLKSVSITHNLQTVDGSRLSPIHCKQEKTRVGARVPVCDVPSLYHPMALLWAYQRFTCFRGTRDSNPKFLSRTRRGIHHHFQG